MKRDKEWLKDRLESSRETDMRMRKLYEPNSVEHRHFNGRLAAIDEVLDFIDELDEPEVLSQEWIRINQERKGVHFFVNVTKLQNLIVPKQEEITELDALNRLAQNVQFSADEIASHFEKLSAYNGQVTYGEPETLSQNWIDEHRKSYTMEDSVEISDLQNLLVPKQEEVDRAYKDGYEKGKQHTFCKGYLEGLADKEKEPETVASVIADFYKSFERFKEVISMEVEELEE